MGKIGPVTRTPEDLPEISRRCGRRWSRSAQRASRKRPGQPGSRRNWRWPRPRPPTLWQPAAAQVGRGYHQDAGGDLAAVEGDPACPLEHNLPVAERFVVLTPRWWTELPSEPVSGIRREASFWHFIPPDARVRARKERRASRHDRPICRRRTRLRGEITEPSGI